jgi:putative membrane protein
MPENDPRVFFAAERTLLAWIRTSIGLVGLGFVVARFGLFLRLIRPVEDPGRQLPSAALGVLLSLVGAATAAIATWQHRRFVTTLGPSEFPPRYRAEFAVFLGMGLTAAGLLLALELIVSER